MRRAPRTDAHSTSAASTSSGGSASPAGEAVAPLFITLDPERDTQKLLAEYVPAFHARLTGLTGDAKSIAEAARAYKVYYAKVATKGWSRYTVDHSSFVYLMGRDGRYLGYFPPGTSAQRMLEVLRPHLERPPARYP